MMDTVIEHAALIFDQSWLMALQIEDTIPQCGNGLCIPISAHLPYGDRICLIPLFVTTYTLHININKIF